MIGDSTNSNDEALLEAEVCSFISSVPCKCLVREAVFNLWKYESSDTAEKIDFGWGKEEGKSFFSRFEDTDVSKSKLIANTVVAK